MYVMILKHLVRRKIIGEFKKAVIDSGLSAIFDEVQDLDYLIRDMNNVLGETLLSGRIMMLIQLITILLM